MNKAFISIAAILFMSGCASINPPPDRQHWDSVATSTQCTTEKSGVNGQYAGSLLASILGGANIGASIAAGTFPIIGIPLAGLGIAGASDVGNKYDQIEKCVEFKQYVSIRENKKSNTANATTEQKLKNLKDMLDRSIITPNEYETARNNILSKI